MALSIIIFNIILFIITVIDNRFILFFALVFFIKSLTFFAAWLNYIKFYWVVIILIIIFIIFIEARHRL